MGRPSKATERRAQLIRAFAAQLACTGYEGATIATVAARAGVAPGMVHHYFTNKAAMLDALLDAVEVQISQRLQQRIISGAGYGQAYLDAALRLDAHADVQLAKCWVGIFAEAQRNPQLLRRLRRLLARQVAWLIKYAQLREADAVALLTFIIGALVTGALTPPTVRGYAAPAAYRLLDALTAQAEPPNALRGNRKN